MRRAILSATVAALAGLQVHAQTPQSFRVEVNIVEIDVTVADEHGTAVAGLTAADFEVFEDGQPQKIETFSQVDITAPEPVRFAGVDRPIVPDVGSNREPVSGRTYVLVLDDINISPLRMPDVRAAARRFVESYFGAGDVAAVAYTSGRVDASQDFTSDPQRLLASIDKFLGRGVQSSALEAADTYERDRMTLSLDPAFANLRPDEIADIARQMQDSRSKTLGTSAKPTVDITDFERAQRAITVFDAIRALAQALSPIRGRRKAVVMFSEGLNYQLGEPFGMRSVSDVLRATQDTLDAASRANVSFYTIDPRGLVGAGTDFMQMTGPGIDNGGTQTAILDDLKVSQDSLRVLADETGGFAALNSNGVATAFERIVQSNSQYYLIGYTPPRHLQDGRFHKIAVRVKRPGMAVTARRGYASPHAETLEEGKRREAARAVRDAKRPSGDTTSPGLRDVLGGPLQQSGLGLSVHAASFRHTDRNASVALAVEIEGPRLPLTPPGKLELSFYEVDDSGRPGSGVRKQIDLALRPDTATRVKAHGIRLNPRIVLAPGRYQLRVGARESAAGESGSVFYDLTVPDFSKDPLVLSGLLLSSVSAQQTPTAEADPIASKVLPGAATSRRAFPSGDTLAVYAEAYSNNSSGPPPQINVTVRLIADDGEEVFTAKDSMPAANPSKIFSQFALEDLTPGAYLLRVEAQLSGPDPHPVARETLLRVVP